MAKRKQRSDLDRVGDMHLNDEVEKRTNKDMVMLGSGQGNQEPIKPTVGEAIGKPRTETKGDFLVASTVQPIHAGPDENIESLTSHHYKTGARAREVNKAELETCMEMLITGFIHFTGQYHDNRKKEFYNHLVKHYEELGLIVPLLK